MERLEAALSKARELRKAAMTGSAPAPRHSSRRSQAAADWAGLKAITLTADHARKHRLSALSGGKDAVPYDMLRSRAVRMMKEKDWTRVGVTSPDAGCGKSTIAANLALSMARQKDLRIMLLDVDLRRPSLHKSFGVPAQTSFWEVLDGRIPFEDHAVRLGENLILGVNTTPARSPSELLQSERAHQVLDQIERAYQPDIIVFDMSPMLSTDENVGFLGHVDAAILVAAAERTTLPSIDTCEKELAQLTNVLGIVLNKCRYPDKESAGGYGVI
jgi:Mrp family chromosome partitioning ATPase